MCWPIGFASQCEAECFHGNLQCPSTLTKWTWYWCTQLSHALSLNIVSNLYSECLPYIFPCSSVNKSWACNFFLLCADPEKCILTSLCWACVPVLYVLCFLTFSSTLSGVFFSFCLSVALCGLGESDDAYLSISGGWRLLRVSVLLESGQQEEAADPLRPRVQPTLQFRTQEIRHCGRPKDIRLRCCFYPGCLTSKGTVGNVYYMCVLCMYACVVFKVSCGNSTPQGQRDVFMLAGCGQRLREKMPVLGQGAFLPVWAQQLGLLSPLGNDLNPLQLYLTSPFIEQLYLTSDLCSQQKAYPVRSKTKVRYMFTIWWLGGRPVLLSPQLKTNTIVF